MQESWVAIETDGFPADDIEVDVRGTEQLMGDHHLFENRAKRLNGAWWSIDGESLYPDDHFAITHWRRPAS